MSDFVDEYRVPLLPPLLAAVLGTAGELFFPLLLVLGLFGRIGAAGLFAVNALAAEPPLGKVRGFVLEAGRLDLKKFGARLFVDAARILGIACGEPGTVARLRHAVVAGALAAGDGEAAVAAFHHLQRIRLLRQRRGATGDNRIDPDDLNEFDRRLLLEAFKQARLLQQRLKTLFRIEG